MILIKLKQQACNQNVLSTEIKHETQDTVFDYSLMLLLISVNKFPSSKVYAFNIYQIKYTHVHIEQKYKTCTFIA